MMQNDEFLNANTELKKTNVTELKRSSFGISNKLKRGTIKQLKLSSREIWNKLEWSSLSISNKLKSPLPWDVKQTKMMVSWDLDSPLEAYKTSNAPQTGKVIIFTDYLERCQFATICKEPINSRRINPKKTHQFHLKSRNRPLDHQNNLWCTNLWL